MSVISRQAELSDLPELLRLEAASFSGDRLSRRSLRRLLRSSTALCLVVDGEEGLAGYALWLYRRNSAQVRLYSIAVDEQSQGRGVGASLLAAGEAQSTERGCSRMSLEVKTHNHSAVHLYRKLGFEEVGVWPCYYEDGTDALRLVKELPMSTALSAGR